MFLLPFFLIPAPRLKLALRSPSQFVSLRDGLSSTPDSFPLCQSDHALELHCGISPILRDGFGLGCINFAIGTFNDYAISGLHQWLSQSTYFCAVVSKSLIGIFSDSCHGGLPSHMVINREPHLRPIPHSVPMNPDHEEVHPAARPISSSSTTGPANRPASSAVPTAPPVRSRSSNTTIHHTL